MSGIKAVVVPRDLYYHEIAYVRGLETEVEALKARAEAAEKRIDDLLEQAEKTRLVMVRRWGDTLQWKARAEAAEKEAKRWKDVAKNLASSAETDRDAAIFDKAVAGGKVKLAEARAEATEKRAAVLREALTALLQHSCITEIGDVDKFPADIDAEYFARAALEAKPSSILPTAAPWEGGKP